MCVCGGGGGAAWTPHENLTLMKSRASSPSRPCVVETVKLSVLRYTCLIEPKTSKYRLMVVNQLPSVRRSERQKKTDTKFILAAGHSAQDTTHPIPGT